MLLLFTFVSKPNLYFHLTMTYNYSNVDCLQNALVFMSSDQTIFFCTQGQRDQIILPNEMVCMLQMQITYFAGDFASVIRL